MKVENIIFDFDGTVVDSYPGILNAFNSAYKKVYGVDNTINIKPYIGPPIYKILTAVNGEEDQDIIDRYVARFKEEYDTKDYKLTVLYDGMEQLLKQLQQAGCKLLLATNKREKSTRLIAEYLGVSHYFSGYYCSDLANKNYASKVQMVDDLLNCEKLDPARTVLIGDTDHDEMAAKQNGIIFIYAAYGFGNLQGCKWSISYPLKTLEVINLIEDETKSIVIS